MERISSILVTGGAGFIGSHLVRKLVEKGKDVTILDNLRFGRIENIGAYMGKVNFKLIEGDIRDRKAVRKAMKEVDAIVHLAALINVKESVIKPLETHDVNVHGTLVLLDEAAKLGVKRFLFASSTAVYGEGNPLPLREDYPLKPISPYAASKAAAEHYCTAFQTSFGLQVTVLRFFNAYGSKNQPNSYANVIATFLNRILKNEPLVIFGDGGQTRDFVYIDDVINAIVLALDSDSSVNEVINVCTGKPTTINELAQITKEIAGRDTQITYGRPRKGDLYHNYGDPTKAEKMIGFKAEIGLREGLKRLINEIRQGDV
jgi:UDP-glucose 4-epimerase